MEWAGTEEINSAQMGWSGVALVGSETVIGIGIMVTHHERVAVDFGIDRRRRNGKRSLVAFDDGALGAGVIRQGESIK